MAVVDKYTDANVAVKNKTFSVLTGVGADIFHAQGQAAIAAADDDGSVYRVLKDVPASYIPSRILITNSAITGGTSYDIGIYNTNMGSAKAANYFMAAQTMATARTTKVAVDTLTAVIEADFNKSLAEIAGDLVNPPLSYDLCIRANTVGTVAGTVSVFATFIQK